MAGLVDGEGSVIARKRKDGTISSYKLNIANTNFSLLRWCRRVAGVGNVGVQVRRRPHKDCGAYWVYGVNATSLLKQLLPYLRIKGPKARTAIRRMAA